MLETRVIAQMKGLLILIKSDQHIDTSALLLPPLVVDEEVMPDLTFMLLHDGSERKAPKLVDSHNRTYNKKVNNWLIHRSQGGGIHLLE